MCYRADQAPTETLTLAYRSVLRGHSGTLAQARVQPLDRVAGTVGQLRPLTRARLLQRLAATRPESGRDSELRGSMLALRSVARRVLELTAEERALAREIEALTRKLAPQLLDQPGVGPHAAAQLVLSWSHHGRIRSEAAFARLAGAAPIPASSGQTVRYRLDRSGDRKLNRAFHLILVTRKRTHPPTRGLHRATDPGRQDPTRSKPLPQALPRTKPLSPTRAPTNARLTNIEESLAPRRARASAPAPKALLARAPAYKESRCSEIASNSAWLAARTRRARALKVRQRGTAANGLVYSGRRRGSVIRSCVSPTPRM